MDGSPYNHFVWNSLRQSNEYSRIGRCRYERVDRKIERSYIDKACEHAARLSELRDNRGHWRYQLQASPLGDASDLLCHLRLLSVR